mmetsp:Transcript_13216/g.30777  ORF Transcript_13216/g.30777 Transcript_13216/m.30777 type:complete len:111 (-) Transcript_13216:95-427(-)
MRRRRRLLRPKVPMEMVEDCQAHNEHPRLVRTFTPQKRWIVRTTLDDLPGGKNQNHGTFEEAPIRKRIEAAISAVSSRVPVRCRRKEFACYVNNKLVVVRTAAHEVLGIV